MAYDHGEHGLASCDRAVPRGSVTAACATCMIASVLLNATKFNGATAQPRIATPCLRNMISSIAGRNRRRAVCQYRRSSINQQQCALMHSPRLHQTYVQAAHTSGPERPASSVSCWASWLLVAATAVM